MKSAALPDDEIPRPRAVHSYDLLGSVQDEALSSLVRVASSVCEAPIALVTVVDGGRQRLVASTGLPDLDEPPEMAFSAHVMRSREIMVVEDATLDARFAGNPFVLGEPRVRFCAGCALIDQVGVALGALCVVDQVPRRLAPFQANVLRELSTAIVRLIEARKIDDALFAAELAAKNARAELKVVLNAVAAGVAYWDKDLRIRFANVTFLRWSGLSEAIRGRHFREVLGEARFAAEEPLIDRALRGEPQRVERSIEVGAGKHRHTVVTFTPDVQNGQVVGIISTANDVTDPVTALLTSKQRNELLMLAEQVSEVGHWRTEVGTDRQYWSPQVYRIHGRDPATFVPTLTNGIEAYHPDDRATVAELVRRAVERQEPFAFEHRIVRPDGSVRRVESKGRCEIDPSTGLTRSLFGVFQDVTERHALRERLARQERLVTAGTLAAGVGHEINNPLTYVSANLEYVIDRLGTLAGELPSSTLSDVVDVLGEAREGADRITKIVRGLRSFARQDAPLAPTDVHTAIGVAADLAVHELRGRATLSMELGEVPRVLADEPRLAQVFVNLLVNAAQAFPEGDPEANRIVVRTRLLGDGRVEVAVADNGPGIAGDVLPRIFDPFFTTKDIGRGTGLGLAISHSIVASTGGEIWCSTEPGKGTTFSVVLAPATPSATTGEPERPRVEEGRRGRVLVVDDEPAVLRIIERTLRGEHDVVLHADSREALRALQQPDATFDAIFCDLVMPHMSGMELYLHARRHDGAVADRFVFLSGGTVDDGLTAFLAEVPNERLEKPFSNQQLRAVARRLASNRVGAQ